MIPQPIPFIAKACLVLAVTVLLSQATDADLLDSETVPNNLLRATTLDLATRDTANSTQKSLFFNVQGLLPSGFQVSSVRIQNEGELDLQYQIEVLPSGESALCSALQLRVLDNWRTSYEGALSAFQYSNTLSSNTFQDLVFSVSLPEGGAELVAQNCNFNFRVQSTQEAGGGSVVFSDEEILQNQVVTGQWSL